MAWIEFHATRIKRLKKFQEFCRLLRWSPVEALGFLGLFWGEVIELAEDGHISGWNPEYIAQLTGIRNHPEHVWNALVTCGWIDQRDGKVLVHDWLDVAAGYLRGKYAKESRDVLVRIWALHGRSYGNPIGPPLDSSCTKEVSFKVLDKTDVTPSTAFEWIWKQYPRPDGKKEALRHFLASVKTQSDFESIQAALRNYKAYLAKRSVEPQYIKMGSTWFNNWQDWVNYAEVKNASNGSQGLSVYADIARKAREAQGLRAISSEREVLAGIRNLSNARSETKSGD